MLSIVIPVYNEESELPRFLDMARKWTHPHELVFCDGGSTDRTLELLAGHTVVSGAQTRGAEIQDGINASNSDRLLILHVDCSLENSALVNIERALNEGADWGCLTVDFTSHAPHYRFGIRKSNLRARHGGTPFGDQGMFMTRDALDAVGGIPDLCFMEDYELSRRLRKKFGWPVQLEDVITASVRRFEAGNPTLIGLQMGFLRMLYRLGVPAERLLKIYGFVR